MARKGIGGHHSASAATVEWLTPPEVLAALVGHDGPVRVADVWRAVANHPRARRSRHPREKIRQTLQRHAERVGPDRWRRKETA